MSIPTARRNVRMNSICATLWGTKHWPRQKSIQKLKAAIRLKTRRTNDTSLPCIVDDLEPTLCGWFQYFRHSSYRNVSHDLDGWIRMRPRSILRKRLGRKGRGRGNDHQRWTKEILRRTRAVQSRHSP
jgi:hypothetical protein